MSHTPDPALPEQELLGLLREVTSFEITRFDKETDDQLGTLEERRRQTVRLAAENRQKRDALKSLVKDSSGFETTTSGQFQKLNLANHLHLDSKICPVCQEKSQFGADIAKDIADSLSLIEKEVASVQLVTPELLDQLEQAEKDLKSATGLTREIERQIRSAIQQNDALKRADDLAQARAIILGRVEQFLETTVEDFQQRPINFENLRSKIEELQDLVDPQALRDRIAHAENMVSNYASEMLSSLPTTAPLTDARLQFLADGRIRVIEAERQRQINLVDVGSDQNYLAIHLALLFGLHKHFEQSSSPVPGLLVIDQISRPYYPRDGRAQDERTLEEMAQDDDRRSMGKIVDFIFAETAKAAGLQVLLIEHAYMENDSRYVNATVERWTRANGQKLIPDDWPVREA